VFEIVAKDPLLQRHEIVRPRRLAAFAPFASTLAVVWRNPRQRNICTHQQEVSKQDCCCPVTPKNMLAPASFKPALFSAVPCPTRPCPAHPASGGIGGTLETAEPGLGAPCCLSALSQIGVATRPPVHVSRRFSTRRTHIHSHSTCYLVQLPVIATLPVPATGRSWPCPVAATSRAKPHAPNLRLGGLAPGLSYVPPRFPGSCGVSEPSHPPSSPVGIWQPSVTFALHSTATLRVLN
jgi:hypothetical protein